jgi:hypothetical protein
MNEHRMHAARWPTVVMLLDAMVAGVTARAAGADHAWTIPGTLRIGITASPNTLNPLFATAGYETFIDRSRARGDGAERGQRRDQPRRPHDHLSSAPRRALAGRRAPFTSADVAFTQRATMNPANDIVVRRVELQLKSLQASVLYAVNGPGFGSDFDLAFTPFIWAPDPDDTLLFSPARIARRAAPPTRTSSGSSSTTSRKSSRCGRSISKR